MRKRQKIYDQYWEFAFERQETFFKKLIGVDPYTQDLIIREYKFCNTYRASDRVSQFLISKVIYSGKYDELDILFRIFLFRLLNKSETWKLLEEKLGDIRLNNFSFELYSKVLNEIRELQPIYGNAFILCANKLFGYDRKHENHLALLENVFIKTNKGKGLVDSESLKELFENLRALPLIGDFMAYQIAVDFNYSEVFDFSENDFTIAGPGAVRGIRKCFENIGDKGNDYVIKYMVENQNKEFERLGLKFRNLFGRPLHAIDCQGLFCETDKYTRVAFPELKSNRKKIKAKYKPTGKSINLFYPPKWKINDGIRL